MVNLTNTTGTVTKTYDYSAFGIEQNQDTTDNNPFRYCGEYYDAETGTYYLRARYYNPSVGRFTQMDTHWNIANMIYGDNPQKINERQDAVGTALYSYRPQISAMMQSGNLYVHCVNNPVTLVDRSGHDAVALQWIPSLSEALPWLASGVATGIASLKAAIGTSWHVPVAVGAVALSVAAIGITLHNAAEYIDEASLARAWVDTRIAENSLSSNHLRDNSVYVIVNRETQKVWYVGLTKNFSSRQYAHQAGSNAKYPYDQYNMLPIATGMTRSEARALEQALITAYTLDALNNAINSISPEKWSDFSSEFARAYSLIKGYLND